MTALVVLPGLDGTATLHTEFLTAVGTAFDSVVVIPYPPDKALGYAALERLVRAQLPPTTPFVLLGESFSGPIALSVAADPPPNLVGLVLSTTFAKTPVPLLSPLATLTRIAPVRSLPPSVLSWLLLGRWATPQLEASLQTALLAVNPAVLRFRAAAAIRANVSARLSSISAPLLYLRATHDRLLSVTAGRHILSALPQCTTADVAGPHLLLQAAPTECARAVAAFSRHLG
ncbi:alpha/beta fold hydrolase [Marilutibacter alkalisoli]|uniref:Lysophospholipase n=1 Tax=Marilutibacter alkalisoli TaxID=2591633 RepID=A0A514BUR1_9GAMM|nr:lysophospholipase [Lysobacter alkalisoli]